MAALGRRPGRRRGPGRAAPGGGDRRSNAWGWTGAGRSGRSRRWPGRCGGRGPGWSRASCSTPTSPSRLAAPLAGRPWVVGGLRVAERQRRWHLTLDRLTSRLSTGSVCVSEGVRRFSVEAGRLDPDRLAVIPNGVDPAPFDRAEAVDRAAPGRPARRLPGALRRPARPPEGARIPARRGRRGSPRPAPTGTSPWPATAPSARRSGRGSRADARPGRPGPLARPPRRRAGPAQGGRPAGPPLALGGDAQRRPGGDGRPAGGGGHGGRGDRGPGRSPAGPAGSSRRATPSALAGALLDAASDPGAAPPIRRGRPGAGRGRVHARPGGRGLRAALGGRPRARPEADSGLDFATWPCGTSRIGRR